MKRRNFLVTGALSVGGLGVTSCQNSRKEVIDKEIPSYSIPSYKASKLQQGKSVLGAGEKIVLALIGAGGWGTHHAINLAKMNANTEVKYVCDVDDTRGGRAVAELEKVQGYKPQKVRDMRKVYDDQDIDAVIIVTPEHWHALATIWACEAGKDVYVEKCISHNLTEGQKIAAAAIKNESVVQCGLQNRSAHYLQEAKEYIEQGGLGKIVSITVDGLLTGPIPFNEKEDSDTPDNIDWDMWLGPAPKVPYNVSRNRSWYHYWDYGGGIAFTNGVIHQLDMTRMLIGDPGMPKSVVCSGGRMLFDDNRDTPDFQTLIADYGDFFINLRAGEFTPYMHKATTEVRYSTDKMPPWHNLSTKVVIYGTEAMMVVGRMGGGWQVFGENGEVIEQRYGMFPLEAHMQNFLDCVRNRNTPNANAIQSHLSAAVLHQGNISYRLGSEKAWVDTNTERITNLQEAGKLEDGYYRKGFEIPELSLENVSA
jgi:predicted dehydrogenase